MLGRFLLLALSLAMLGAGIAEVHFATTCTGSCGDSEGLGVFLIAAAVAPLAAGVMDTQSSVRPFLTVTSVLLGVGFIALVVWVVVALSSGAFD
jgi:hypothetical protein